MIVRLPPAVSKNLLNGLERDQAAKYRKNPKLKEAVEAIRNYLASN